MAVIISYGVLLGTATSSQLAAMAFFEVLAQVLNEYLNDTYFHVRQKIIENKK